MRRTITVRGVAIIILVAVICSLLSRKLSNRRHEYLGEAAYHHRRTIEETTNLGLLGQSRKQEDPPFSARGFVKLEESCRLRIAYHADLEKRYDVAANRPWQDVGYVGNEPGESLLFEGFLDFSLD